jgi:non-lysosomal glucosylceramidase
MLYAALHAAAELASHLGDEASAARYREAAITGAARMDELLFNGEFYVQQLPAGDTHRYQFGDGCLADQLFGQTLAHLTGLGHLFPADHVRSAIAAVHRHNLRRDVGDHDNVQRSYAVAGDGGLLLCSWPNGGRPELPFVYSDEVWTGVEYQVATHLVYEGFVDEALEVVRTVRARHDGVRRNPWNEAECGNHYARSLAAWGLVVALSGAHANAARSELRFAPAVDGDVATVFSTGSAWGRVRLSRGTAELVVLGGELPPTAITIAPFGSDDAAATIFRTGRPTTAGGVIRFPIPNE